MLDDNPLDFIMKEGTDRTLILYVREKDDITGVVSVVDITGWTFYFEIRRSREAASAYISKDSTSSSEILLATPASGELHIFIKNTDFSVSPKYNTPYYCECFGVTPGGQRFDIGDGNVIFLRKVVEIA